MFGAWCALLLIVAQQPNRGLLSSNQQTPFSWGMVARATGFPAKLFERLAEWASRDEVGLLVPYEPDNDQIDEERIEENTAINGEFQDDQQSDNNQATDDQQPISGRSTNDQPTVVLPDITGPDITGHNRTIQKPDLTGPDKEQPTITGSSTSKPPASPLRLHEPPPDDSVRIDLEARRTAAQNALAAMQAGSGEAGVFANDSEAGFLQAGQAGDDPPSKPSPEPAAKRSKASVFDSITEEVLRDTSKLTAWHVNASKQAKPVVDHSEANELRIVATAERALEVGSNPSALFTEIVSRAKWDYITQDQEQRASERIKALRQGRNVISTTTCKSKPPPKQARRAASGT